MVRDGAAGAGHGRRMPPTLLDADTGEEPEASGGASVPLPGGDGRVGSVVE